MDRLIFIVSAIACLVAAALPVASGKPQVVRLYVKPAMFLDCGASFHDEFHRTCRARSKSL